VRALLLNYFFRPKIKDYNRDINLLQYDTYGHPYYRFPKIEESRYTIGYTAREIERE